MSASREPSAPPAPSPAVPATNRRSLGALRHRNFTILWSSLIVSNIGTWMQTVAQGWLVLELTNRPVYLGLVSLAFAIPMTVLPPLGGAIADRVDKLTLLKITQTLSMLAAFVLAALTLSGLVNVWQIILLSFVGALLLAVDNPTRQALLPSLVGRDDLMSAISLNSAVFTGAALFGPAIAGFLLASIGAGGLFLINGISYAVVLIALFLMRDAPTKPHHSEVGFWRDVVEGLRFVRSSELLAILVAVSAVSGLLGRSYSALLPLFARDVWDVGARGYGILLSAPGAGALIGAVGLAVYGEVRRKGRLLILSMLAFGLSLVAFSYSPFFWPAVALLLVGGVLNSLFGASIATLIQTNAPGRLRGRAMSLYTVTIIGVPSLGAMGTASVAEWLGAR
ncbi:MAG: MFS transporter, partial [Chloroflexota bacterium]|nr:MFS transporter [Chloroflexota bacterium]